MAITLEVPNEQLLPSYTAALQTGWSPSNTRDLAGPHLAAIEADPDAFLADYEWKPHQTMVEPGGQVVPRLPGQVYWISDGEFCGFLGFRYQPGTTALPPYVAGHIGYGVVPWKRGRGMAAQAVRAVLPVARAAGLARVSITTGPLNAISLAVIRSLGGVRAPETDGIDAHGPWIGFWVATSDQTAR